MISPYVYLALLSLSVFLRGNLFVAQASDANYPVHNINSGLNYTTIQEAINAPETLDGHVLRVDDGTYTERVSINKSVSLIGENPETTVIDGGVEGGAVVMITVDNVTVSGFAIRSITHYESATPSYGVTIEEVGHCNVSGNWITYNDYGVELDSSPNNIFSGNNITSNDAAMHIVSSKSNVIIGNSIVTNGIGIWLSDCSYNNLTGNDIADNVQGIWLSSSSSNTVTENNIAESSKIGLELSGGSLNNTITNNTFVKDGLHISESYQNIIDDNSVNGKPLVYLNGVADQMIGNAGQVILVNCSDILVEGLELSNTTIGVELWMTSNSVIAGNSMVSNTIGSVWILDSSNNTVSGNNVTANSIGHCVLLSSSSNNTVTGNNITANGGIGILVSGSSNNNITMNNIRENSGAGIDLGSSSTNNYITENDVISNNDGILVSSNNNSIIMNNFTDNFAHGIELYFSASGNVVTRNNITYNNKGIFIASSDNNTFTENKVEDNGFGVELDSSSDNVLRGNLITDNQQNFGVQGSDLSDFFNDVDSTNIVDGKRVYYWISRQDQIVPSDAGYVAVINSTNIKVQNLNLRNNIQGVLFSVTYNSSIQNVTFTGNSYGVWCEFTENINISGCQMVENVGDGVWFQYSSGSYIKGNNIASNEGFGIVFGFSSNCSIIGNNITDNEYDGIWCRGSSNSSIYENNITGNKGDGIFLPSSLGNRIFHNNFVDNSRQVSLYDSANVWDDGYPSGGNYWSDYAGEDSNSDGIGDTPYAIDGSNEDHYPLMGMFGSFNTSLGSVNVVSNSTIANFRYFELNNTIKMQVANTTANQTFGFCRICIPHSLMTEPYNVVINGSEPYFANYTLYDNGADRWIYFSYEHSTLEVVIIPEFAQVAIIMLFFVATILAVILYRSRCLRVPSHRRSEG